MVLLENPEIAALPSIANIKRASEPIEKASAAPHVTVNSKLNEVESGIPTNYQFQLEEHPVDVVRPIKVGIIGAGIAGITAGVLLPAKLPGLDLRIYDKNADVVCQ